MAAAEVEERAMPMTTIHINMITDLPIAMAMSQDRRQDTVTPPVPKPECPTMSTGRVQIKFTTQAHQWITPTAHIP